MVRTRMSPETLYLIDLCAGQRGLAAAHSPELGPDFDWTRFLEAADRHKVTGLAYRAYARGSEPSPPPDILARLKREASAKAAHRAMLLPEWRRVESALKSADIRVLMMKGPALSLQLYGDPGSREYHDIDLLVDAKALERAIDVFATIGYEAFEGKPIKGKREFVINNSRHIIFKRQGLPAYFEVHGNKGRNIGLSPIGIEEAFERSEGMQYEGLSFPTLGRSDHALLVLLHGAYHGWCTLQWVLDSASFLGEPEFSLAAKRSKDWDGIDPVYALDSFTIMAHRLFDEPGLDRYYPQSALRIKRGRSIAGSAFAQLAAGGAGSMRITSMIKGKIFLTKLTRGLYSKIRANAWLIIPNQNDLAAFRGIELPLIVYYLARPFLVVARLARRALNRSVA